MRILLIFSLAFTLLSPVYAQIDSSEALNECDSWGGAVLDIGFNQYTNNPDILDLDTWKSKGVNMYTYMVLPFGCSKFNLAVGLGLGLENYFFEDKSVRLSSFGDSLTITNDAMSPPPITQTLVHQKSKLSANYFDIPLELRFQTGRYPHKTFRMAVGGKIGILFSSHTKVKYINALDGATRKEKMHDDFALENMRYGLTARIGYSYLNLFGYYSLSTLFKENKGPEITPFMIGISLSPDYLFNLK
jgi:hypothetical protein